MAFSFDITNPPSPQDIESKFRNLVKSCFPGIDDTALLPAAPLGMLIQQLTLTELDRINNVLYEINKRQGNVQGADLDAQLINNFGLYRKPASHGVAKITIYGEPFYTVQRGFEVVGINTNPFRLLYNVTIPASGKIEVDMQEVHFSTTAYKANTLVYIVNTDYNIHRVSQSEVTQPGRPAEDDLAFISRAYTWGALSNNGSFSAIMSRVASVIGVTKCNGYENNDVKSNTYQGVVFSPHSVGIVAYGGVDYQIAEAIHASKPPGTVLMGTSEVKLQVGTKEITYKFYRPTEIPLKVYVKVKLLPLYPNNYESEIKRTLIEYVNTLQINSKILYTGITCALHTMKMTKGYNFEYEEIKFSKRTDNTDIQNVELKFTEMATLDADDIEVTKV